MKDREEERKFIQARAMSTFITINTKCINLGECENHCIQNTKEKDENY